MDEDLKRLLETCYSVLRMLGESQSVPGSIKSEASAASEQIIQYANEHGGLG